MLRISMLVLCILLFPSPCALCASFDCAKAKTFAEKEICSSKELSSLDDRLEASYRKALLNAPDPNSLKSSQRSWMRGTRDACKTKDCLRSAYEERLREMSKAGADKAPGRSRNGITGRYSITKTDFGGTVDVQKISGNQAKFRILTVVGPTSHTCVAEGIASLDSDNRAVFTEKLEGDEGTCTITLTFAECTLKVSTENCSSFCGMRAFMDASYTKTSYTPDFK